MRSPPRDTLENRSVASYKSTQSSRSSVLEKAREYNRRIEAQHEQEERTRARSLERNSKSSTRETTRSRSTGRNSSGGNRVSTRERAMASVEQDAASSRRNGTDPPSTAQKQQQRSISAPDTPKSKASDYGPRRTSTTPRTSKSKLSSARKARQEDDGGGEEQQQQPIVSPELLVDALSGHEDGLLAIAERLMEHYDEGYDVMGEAIIDAFADVQKLFQHVVEAAHMEGAAFEASRREGEMEELRKKGALDDVDVLPSPTTNAGSGPSRHDEYIDPDVKEVLTEAIRKGQPLRQNEQHAECYQLYETACQSASALLPVDSDHRGRLQLSIARAESMSPDRACAILRYAMDDVLRSGLRAGRSSLPDPSKRGDCVLSKPKDHPSLGGPGVQVGVVQSPEEELASLIEEMKEVMGAPVYDNTPLQSVSQRFWAALSEAQRNQMKNEEKLEQNLGKLKGEYLLAKAEWEEKLAVAQDNADTFKKKYMKLKQTRNEDYMEQARSVASSLKGPHSDFDARGVDFNTTFNSARSAPGPGSVATSVSGLAQHARSLAGSFSCGGINERTSSIVCQELNESGDGESKPSTIRKGRGSTDSEDVLAPSRRYSMTETPNRTGTRSRSRTPKRSSTPSGSGRSTTPSRSGTPSRSSTGGPRRSSSMKSFREV